VKKAVAIISARLKESLHRDRGPFRRIHTQDELFPPDDEFISGSHHQPAMEGLDLDSRSSLGQSKARNSAYSAHPSGYAFDSDADPMNERSQLLPYEDLVFRILCPNDKVENIMGASDGIIEMLRGDIGVDVRVNDPVPGSSESVLIITSEEVLANDIYLFLILLTDSIIFIQYFFHVLFCLFINLFTLLCNCILLDDLTWFS